GEFIGRKVENILFEGKSEYQEILVFESSSYGKIVMLDGTLQLTEKDEFAYQEMMAHLPLCSIPNPNKVLLIGGGDGGILREISRHISVETIDICEMDQLVIDVYKRFFPDIAIGYSDPRVRVHMIDGVEFLKGVPEGTYDAIILDAFTPMGVDGKDVEDESLLKAVAKALRPGGVMCSPADSLWRKNFSVTDTIEKCRRFFKGSVNYAWAPMPSYFTGMIGYMLCSTEGSLVNFQNPVNPLNPQSLGVAKQPPRLYTSEVRLWIIIILYIFCLSIFFLIKLRFLWFCSYMQLHFVCRLLPREIEDASKIISCCFDHFVI
ncbi:Spermidine synthase, partial [Linum perenne]